MGKGAQMKRIITLVLAAALVFGASACTLSKRSAEESELPAVELAPVTPIMPEVAAQEDETPEAQSIGKPVSTETEEPEEEITTVEPSGTAPEPKPAESIQTMESEEESHAAEPAETPMVEPEEPEEQPEQIEREADKMIELRINGAAVPVAWEDNESVAALQELLADGAITVQMSMYGGFEQVGPLGTSLPRSDVQTTTGAGDIVLYSGSNIVIFYGSNSWAYTRLGKIRGMSAQELSALLGSGDATVTLVIN